LIWLSCKPTIGSDFILIPLAHSSLIYALFLAANSYVRGKGLTPRFEITEAGLQLWLWCWMPFFVPFFVQVANLRTGDDTPCAALSASP
jgi:hypothetical protein